MDGLQRREEDVQLKDEKGSMDLMFMLGLN